MPAAPAELTARFTLEGPARDAVLAAVRDSGLAREGGPGELVLAGPREAVLNALGDALEAALGAGAHGLDVQLAGADGVARVRGRARARLIAVARGDEAPDTVIEGAQVFLAHTREWVAGDVAIADGMVAGIGSYEGGERIDARGKWLVPGFIDAHMHVESSKLTPAQFARAVLPHGTTAIVCDPHEVANVLGSDGVHWMLDASEGLPLTVFVMAPSCVPASAFESPRRELTVGDMEAILRRRRALGVAEMMNFPGVIAGDPAVLEKLEVRGASHADGHAPGVLGSRAGRLRRGRDPLRPRGDHGRGGAGEAPARDVGAAARGLQRAQPASTCCRWCASTARSSAPSAPTTASRTCCCATATSTRCAGSRWPRACRSRTCS